MVTPEEEASCFLLTLRTWGEPRISLVRRPETQPEFWKKEPRKVPSAGWARPAPSLFLALPLHPLQSRSRHISRTHPGAAICLRWMSSGKAPCLCDHVSLPICKSEALPRPDATRPEAPPPSCILGAVYSVISDSFMDCSLPGSSVPGIFQARISGMGCHFLLQGIILTQGSNLSLSGSSCIGRWILLPLSHLSGKPVFWVKQCPFLRVSSKT